MSFKEQANQYLKIQKEKYWNDLISPSLERLKNLKVPTFMEQYNKEVWGKTGIILINPKTIKDIELDNNGRYISLPEYRLTRIKSYERCYRTSNKDDIRGYIEHRDYAENTDYISVVINNPENKIILSSENNTYDQDPPEKPNKNLITIDINDQIPSKEITEQIEKYFIKNYLIQQKIDLKIENFGDKEYITYSPY